MNRSLYAVALLGFVVACQDSRVTAPSSNVSSALLSVAATSDASDPVYFAPRTVAREGGAPQPVQFALQERDHSLFMEPFRRLRLRAQGKPAGVADTPRRRATAQ